MVIKLTPREKRILTRLADMNDSGKEPISSRKVASQYECEGKLPIRLLRKVWCVIGRSVLENGELIDV